MEGKRCYRIIDRETGKAMTYVEEHMPATFQFGKRGYLAERECDLNDVTQNWEVNHCPTHAQ